MRKLMTCAVAALAGGLIAACAGPTRYSTGAVSNYPANPCFGPNLPFSVGSAASELVQRGGPAQCVALGEQRRLGFRFP